MRVERRKGSRRGPEDAPEGHHDWREDGLLFFEGTFASRFTPPRSTSSDSLLIFWSATLFSAIRLSLVACRLSICTGFRVTPG